MAVIDPTSALILGGAYVGKELVVDAAKKMLGPSWDVIGNRLKYKLFGPHIGEVITDAGRMTVELGLDPQPVPGRILMPLAEHASFEEEAALRKKWASLLAKASSRGLENKILPAYVDILRQLTPQEAQIVDWMYDTTMVYDKPDNAVTWADVERSTITERFNLSVSDYALFMTDLTRLQIIENRRQIMRLQDEHPLSKRMNEFADALDTALNFGTPEERRLAAIAASHYDYVGLTALGMSFVEACRFDIKKT